jgi:hypothetical protein
VPAFTWGSTVERENHLRELFRRREDVFSWKFKAVVDWMELEFETVSPTNFWSVKRRCGIEDHVVTPVNEGPGGAATVFRVRLQDVENVGHLREFARHLKGRLDLAADPVTVGAEISLDAYRQGASQAELAGVGAYLYKFNTGRCEKARFLGDVGTKGKVEGISHYKVVQSRLQDGRVLYVGDNGSPGAARCYVKTTNAGHDLEPGQWRARLEDILCPEDVPHRNIERWRGFRFESLQKRRFTFRKLKDDLDPALAWTLNTMAQIGEKKVRSRLDGSTRLFNTHTVADTELNSRVREALRSLSRRWAVDSSHEREHGARSEKMGRKPAANQAVSSEASEISNNSIRQDLDTLKVLWPRLVKPRLKEIMQGIQRPAQRWKSGLRSTKGGQGKAVQARANPAVGGDDRQYARAAHQPAFHAPTLESDHWWRARFQRHSQTYAHRAYRVLITAALVGRVIFL